MMARLLVDGIGNWAFTYNLQPGAVVRIGRTKENELSLPEGRVSTRHAEVSESGGDWCIRDVGSHNGTYLNGKKLTASAALKDGDILKIGNCDLVFQNPNKKREVRHETISMITAHEGTLREFVEDARTSHSTANLPNLMNAGAVSDASPISSGGFSPADNVWLGEAVIAALHTLTLEHDDKYGVFTALVASLKKSIGADNGFVMVVDKKLRRWVIRAWVGDYMEWNSYEQEHPLPLTIAKKAMDEKRILSNAVSGTDAEAASASFKQLNVAGYIAAPLVEGNESLGIFYFDTRESQKMFTPRDVELISRLGGYVLEIEKRET